MRTLGYILRFLILLGFFGLVGLIAYTLVSDLPAPEREIVIPLPSPTTE